MQLIEQNSLFCPVIGKEKCVKYLSYYKTTGIARRSP